MRSNVLKKPQAIGMGICRGARVARTYTDPGLALIFLYVVRFVPQPLHLSKRTDPLDRILIESPMKFSLK
jgi:hypothetical protein